MTISAALVWPAVWVSDIMNKVGMHSKSISYITRQPFPIFTDREQTNVTVSGRTEIWSKTVLWDKLIKQLTETCRWKHLNIFYFFRQFLEQTFWNKTYTQVTTHHPMMVTPVIMCGEPRSNVVHASCSSGITQKVSGLSVMRGKPH